MTVQLISVFPSPVLVSEIENFKNIKKELNNWIENYQKNQNNYQISGRHAWQSPTDFYKREKSFFKYKNLIEKSISEILITLTNKNYKISNMWINVNGPGGYNVLHTHPNSDLSGVFWINCPKNCGNLVFESPNHFTQYKTIESCDEQIKQSLNYYNNFWLEPTEGKLIIFPSDLKHFVKENLSNEDRISISFNIKLNI